MSENEARGDEVYRPHGEAEPGESQPDMENALGEPDADRILDTGYSPPDRPLAAERHGTTAGEQRAGETLDQRLAQEEPERDDAGAGTGSQTVPGEDEAGAAGGEESEDMSGDPHGDASTAGRERAGRMAPAEERPPVRHLSVVARDTGIDGGAASAEEAAVHVVEEEPERGT
ncbi:DUF5709 domain-containing protein [Streptomyces polychromogenes]|uniref:DUF5709 domain-containing protein n=1 Tax=Streptomyces polychromogenes TaxID=67342 RepID=A0ABP3F204_9ACTN